MKTISIEVPDNIDEVEFINFALFFVEGKLREEEMIVPKETKTAFETKVDEVFAANELPKRFEKTAVEIIK